MHYPGMDQGYHAWQFVYAVFLLWSSGIGTFFLMATARDPMTVLAQLNQTHIGKCVTIWVSISLLATTFAWPVLFLGPIYSMELFQMPATVTVISISYTVMILILSVRLIHARFAGIPIPH